tara:strand:+ start:840 stop:1691 length:852 start_codon:yes stop_codon:yes gene_type:complete
MKPSQIVLHEHMQRVLKYWDPELSRNEETFRTFALSETHALVKMKVEVGTPTVWYMAWYALSKGVSMESGCDEHYYNPYTVLSVAIEEEKCVINQWKYPLVVDDVLSSYCCGDTVRRVLSRKPLTHNELHRSQQLHTALTITRSIYMASVELGINNSMSYMQRKWIPEPWTTHLCCNVFKYFVIKLLILERWVPGFIQKNLVFAKDLHEMSILQNVNCIKYRRECGDIICVISYSEAMIIGHSYTLRWKGDLNLAISAWISLSQNVEIQNNASIRKRQRAQDF